MSEYPRYMHKSDRYTSPSPLSSLQLLPLSVAVLSPPAHFQALALRSHYCADLPYQLLPQSGTSQMQLPEVPWSKQAPSTLLPCAYASYHASPFPDSESVTSPDSPHGLFCFSYLSANYSLLFTLLSRMNSYVLTLHPRTILLFINCYPLTIILQLTFFFH